MRAHLEKILAQIRGEKAEVLFIDKDTLEELLLELNGMCIAKQGGGIKITKRQGFSGWEFELEEGSGTSDNPYVMGSQATVGGGSTAYNDTWTLEGGGTTNGTDAVAGDFDGVQWAGPRLNITADSTIEIEDSGTDAVPGITTTIRVISRPTTYNASGKLVAIGAEAISSDTIIQLDGNYAIP